MIVQIDNKMYKVRWEHETPRSFVQPPWKNKLVKINGGTSCYIEELLSISTKRLIGLAELKCYYKDQFSKETGRKISMTKALENAGFSKEERTVFWETYFARLVPADSKKPVHGTEKVEA